MSLDITCNRCNSPVAHVCNPDIKTNLLQMYRYRPRWVSDKLVEALKESPYCKEGYEKAPFFSEAFLYCLLGKEDARTVLAYLNNLQASIGLARHGLYPEIAALEKAEDLIAEHENQLRELSRRLCQAKKELPEEEVNKIREEFDAFLAEGDNNKELDQAYARMRALDRMQKSEEQTRANFLSAVSVVASDDKFMKSLEGLDTRTLEDKLRVFLTAFRKSQEED